MRPRNPQPATSPRLAKAGHLLAVVTCAWLSAPVYIYAQEAQAAQEAQGAGHATDPCGPQAQQHTLAQLQAHTQRCQQHPDWLAHLGQRLNEVGQYAEAADHLERALLLAPTHLGAAFAYAVALAGNGDLASAVQLLAQLSTRPDLPATQRQQLVSAQQRMAAGQATALAPPAPDWQTRASAGLRWGYDNNLLGAPRLSSLTLTLPGGDVTLPLDTASQPQPGAFQRADARLQATHTQASGRRTELALALQHRHTPAAPGASTTQVEALAETLPATTGSWASASASQLHTQGGTRYHSTGLAGGWAWAWPHTACQPRLGAEWQSRQLTSNPVLSSHYRGLLASVACQRSAHSPAWQPTHWAISLRHGPDHPTQPERPGGPQRTTSLRATAQWPQWTAEAELTHTRDSSGYSPLLSNNLVRQSTRGLLRLEHTHPLHHWLPGLQAQLGVEVYVQRANLAIFKVNSTSVFAGLRKQW